MIEIEQKKRPAGSGLASLTLSAALVLSALYVLFNGEGLEAIEPHVLFSIWLVLAALATGIWGAQRIWLPRRHRAKIGQPTLSFLLSFVSISIALLALLTK